MSRLIVTRNVALLELLQCARYLRDRDDIIRQAAGLGISKTEIARILGMSRQTVSEIVNRPVTEPGLPQALPQHRGRPAHPEDDT